MVTLRLGIEVMDGLIKSHDVVGVRDSNLRES